MHLLAVILFLSIITYSSKLSKCMNIRILNCHRYMINILNEWQLSVNLSFWISLKRTISNVTFFFPSFHKK